MDRRRPWGLGDAGAPPTDSGGAVLGQAGAPGDPVQLVRGVEQGSGGLAGLGGVSGSPSWQPQTEPTGRPGSVGLPGRGSVVSR